jgi:pimeloyl-ACP methyl ester carboxylesterase
MEPFTIEVPDQVLIDLRDRLARTRWPDDPTGDPWAQGTDPAYLRRLVRRWADGYDWRAEERRLNGFPQYRVDLDGATVHFVHATAAHGAGIPLLLTHGWPSTFAEYLPLVPLLTDPASHGLDGPAFDVVVPSLPGYGFSPRPPVPVTYRYVARRWHRLMRELGYDRFGAAGGDFGAGVATYMALDDPAPLLGIHLTTPEIAPHQDAPWTPAEQAYEDVVAAWDAVERGYSAIQSTKPQTVGYGLNDSPAGLAAWLVEKWRSWTDSGGDPLARFGDLLLTTLTVYWVTGTITSSMRDYYDNRWSGDAIGPADRVRVQTAFASFGHHFVPEGEAPREWLERLYDVRRWTAMPRGGHFAPAEEPALVAADLRAFFGALE